MTVSLWLAGVAFFFGLVCTILAFITSTEASGRAEANAIRWYILATLLWKLS